MSDGQAAIDLGGLLVVGQGVAITSRVEQQVATAADDAGVALGQASGGVEVLQNPGNKSNPALGLFDRFKYPTASVPLCALDRFVLFTDGVYDVEKDGELLSPEWLSSELLKRRDLPFGTMFDQILAELKTYCGDQEFCDDMCLLGMEVAG